MKRKPSLLVDCDICGKPVFQRGLKSHIRLQHKLNVKEVTKVIKPITQVKKQGNTHVMQVKEVIEVTKEYTEYQLPQVKCCRCGCSIKANMSPATLTRLSNYIACDSCIKEWYSDSGRHISFLFGRYDKNGDTISSKIR